MKANEFLSNTALRYSDREIEASLVAAFLRINFIEQDRLNTVLLDAVKDAIPALCDHIEAIETEFTLKQLENVFEAMVDSREKRENGVVFTPEYIVEYIIENSVNGFATIESYIIDPACGSGSILVLAVEYISKHIKKSVCDIISNNIYGLDISADNVRRTKIVLSLYTVLHGDNAQTLEFNIQTADSLKTDWCELFGVKKFDFIIGNPPYVNTHDMQKETIAYLKKEFATTVKGTFNIFYAFIEQSMKHLANDGTLGFIIPNNYLTITAAEPLRRFLSSNQYISRIIDFGENMVFAPVRTYSSLLFLNKKRNTFFTYATIERSENIGRALLDAPLLSLPIAELNPTGWKLLNAIDKKNIERIENVGTQLRKHIRVGIATLRDDVYLLDGFDNEAGLYYKIHLGKKYYIEPEIVRSIYKISNIRTESTLPEAKQYIIFPYTAVKQTSLIGTENNEYQIIPERTMALSFPMCYKYLLDNKAILDERDKGKPNAVAWYAYGRTQGLNYHCRKLLFPTFSARPKFMLEDSRDALFCNGYAIIEDESDSLEILQRVLNSKVMDYYVSLTSYAIEGNYRCYQKKYIQSFSIPDFDLRENQYLRAETSSTAIDEFLRDRYGLSISI